MEIRKAKAVPDKAPGKQLEHYVNGKDRTDGMHPGIRKKCPICNDKSKEAYWLQFKDVPVSENAIEEEMLHERHIFNM